MGDVQFDRATLMVRDTKFNKSRFVPFGPQMGERLTRYVEQRFGGPGDPAAPLFSFTKRGAIHDILNRIDDLNAVHTEAQ